MPSAPGGALDVFARALQPAVTATGVARTVSVENIPGGGQLIALTRFVSAERAVPDAVLVGGSGMLGAAVAFGSPLGLADVTPIARLISEYMVILTPADSPFRTLQDFIEAFRRHPESIAWGGGQARGVEQLLVWQIAVAADVDPRRVTFVPFAGQGEMMPSLLGHQVAVGIGTVGQAVPYLDAHTVRVLGVTSPSRLPEFNAPTLREQGLGVDVEIWKALVAPPGISVADRARLEAAAETVARSSEWRDAIARYQWTDRFLVGPAFARFLSEEEARVRELGRRVNARATNRSATTGPYPTLVLLALAAASVAFARTAPRAPTVRAQRGDAAIRRVAPIAIAMTISVVTLEWAGFVVVASVLFWVTARSFDSTHPWRDAVWAAASSTCAYLLFARLLELPLPAGVLGHWL